MASGKVPEFKTLKECLEFLEWLHSDRKGIGMQGLVAHRLDKFLKERYKSVRPDDIASELTRFLSHVSKFYEQLCKSPQRSYNGRESAKYVTNALLDCIPKMLSALYFLRYNVDPNFTVLGGGGWAMHNPGWAAFFATLRRQPVPGQSEIDDYLIANGDENKYGVIPGGFDPSELKQLGRGGYSTGSSMINDLKAIANKEEHVQNYFLDVFSTTVLSTSGTEIANTANALRLVRDFCRIFEKVDNQDDFEKHLYLKDRCMDWEELKEHCKKLIGPLEDIFKKDRFSFTGYAREHDKLNNEKFAKKMASWFRTNLGAVKNSVGKIQSFSSTNFKVDRRSIRSGKLPSSEAPKVAAYFTENFFCYGFTFYGNTYNANNAPYEDLKRYWDSAMRQLNQSGEGLDKLVKILNGKSCPAVEPQHDEEANEEPEDVELVDEGSGLVPKKVEPPPAKVPEAPNDVPEKKVADQDTRKPEATKTEADKPVTTKGDATPNQGKKSEGAQNQGKKAEGAQNQGKKAEGTLSQGSAASESTSPVSSAAEAVQTQPSSVTSQDLQSSGAPSTGSGHDRGGQSGSAYAAPHGDQGTPKSQVADTTSSPAPGSGSGVDGANSGGGGNVDKRPWWWTEWWDDKRAMKAKLAELRVAEEKTNSIYKENERKRLEQEIKAKHPIVRSSDYYHHYRDPYYNIPPLISQDKYTAGDQDRPTLDGAPQDDRSQARQRLNDTLTNMQNNWDKYYAHQAMMNQYVRDKYIHKSATTNESEILNRQQAEQKYKDTIEKHVHNTSQIPFLSHKSSVPLITERLMPASPYMTDFNGGRIDDPNINKSWSPTPLIQRQPIVPPALPPVEIEIKKIHNPKNIELSEIQKTEFMPVKTIEPKHPILQTFIDVGPFNQTYSDQTQDLINISANVSDVKSSSDFDIIHRYIPPPADIVVSDIPDYVPADSAGSQVLNDHNAPTAPTDKEYDGKGIHSKNEIKTVNIGVNPAFEVIDDGLVIEKIDPPSQPVEAVDLQIDVHKPTLQASSYGIDLEYDHPPLPQIEPVDPIVSATPAINVTFPPVVDPKLTPPEDFDKQTIKQPDITLCLAPWATQTPTHGSTEIPETELFPAEAPRTVRDMLKWLAGLSNKKHHDTLKQCIKKAFSGLHSEPSKLALSINHTNILPDHVFDVLQLTAMFASSVLNSIAPNWKGHAPSATVKPKSSNQSDEPDCCALLCQLRDYAYACHHQLEFLKSQCERDKLSGGWESYEYGSDIKTPSPLQSFLTDGWDSTFETHPFDPCNLCHKSRVKMGFTIKDLPHTSQQGSVISTILTPSCGGECNDAIRVANMQL